METWILSCNIYDWKGQLFTSLRLKSCILLCLPAGKAEVRCVKEEAAALAQQSLVFMAFLPCVGPGPLAHLEFQLQKELDFFLLFGH